MSKSIDYIESESFVVANPDYPVISKENALIAVEISKQETKEKCQTAFRSFILRAVFANVFKETLDFEKEFTSIMSEI